MFCLKYRAGEIGFAFEMAKLSSHPEHIPEHEPKQHYCADGPGEYGIAAGTVQAGEAFLEEFDESQEGAISIERTADLFLNCH